MNKNVSIAPLYKEILMHDGIPGMKKGHRRFRNYDGTLTEAGKERYRYYTPKNPDKKRHTADESAFDYAIKAKERSAKAKERSAKMTEVNDRWFTPNIKAGKDKPPVSRAEAVAKNIEKGADSVSVLATLIDKAHSSNSPRESKSLSDAELQKRINRLQLERRYDELKSADISAGKITTEDIMRGVQATLSIGVAAIATYALIKAK